MTGLRWIPFFLLMIVWVIPTSNLLAQDPYTSSTAQFSANFPAPPVETHHTDKTVIGAIGENIFTAKTPGGTYVVEYSKLPGIAVTFGGHHEIYGKAKKSFLEKTGATEISYTDTTVGGEKAAQLVYKAANGNSGKAWFVLVHDRFYVINANSSKGSGSVDQFLNSFKAM